AEATNAVAVAGPLSALETNVAPIEAAFKAVRPAAVFSLDKAPTPLCRSLASALIAIRDRKPDDYLKAARELYAQVKAADTAKTPFGHAILKFILANRPQAFDTFDFQLEVMSNQVAVLNPAVATGTISIAYAQLCQGRAGWPSAAAKPEAESVKKLNALFEKKLLEQVKAGSFWPPLMTWFRATRAGAGWQNDEAGLELTIQMVQQKTLTAVNYRLDGWTAAATYMWLIRNEFPKLNERFAFASYFDDLYVEECTRSNRLDLAYWNYGGDTQGKIIALATRQLQTNTVLNCSYKTFNANHPLWLWHSRCLRSEFAWRKDHRVDEAERTKLIAMMTNAFGTTRFDEFALGDIDGFAGEDMTVPEGRKRYFDSLSLYMARSRRLPDRVQLPGLGALAKAPGLTEAELGCLASVFPDHTPFVWSAGRSYENLAPILATNSLAKHRVGDLLRAAPFFWKMSKDMNSVPLSRKLGELGGELYAGGYPDAAAVFCSIGMDLLGKSIQDDVRIALMQWRLKAMADIGGIIPVDRADPRFPLFAAQAAYLVGNFQNAWELYQSNPNKVLDMLKDLDPQFSLWLVSKNTEMDDFKKAEDLARGLMQWLDSLSEGVDKDMKARLTVVYADIAIARQEYPRARALLEKVIATKEFEGTMARNDAELRIADIDRRTKNYDLAVSRLERLMRKMDRRLQTESAYQLALIKYEQEEYAESAKLLDQVFAWDPNHAAARILQGNVNLKTKKFQNAADLKNMGITSSQKIIVPGKPLRVFLDDRNLAVAGKAPHIEARAWVESGDEELFSLLPSSDNRTKFEGQLPTVLGPVKRGDHILQILGHDTICYDFSDSFKKANHIANTQALVVTVASDAGLQVSSGKILSEAEEQKRTFEVMMGGAGSESVQASRDPSVVRPGNPVYIQVTDLDQSVTAEKDAVAVKVSSFSGDSVPAFTLRETEPYSGVFEGALPTAPAGAMAFASDTDEGCQPVFAIVSQTNLPPWMGLQNNARPRTFTVDLNDNVSLEAMQLVADVPGRLLKNFYVQVSFNRMDYTTIAAWPTAWPVWNSEPELECVAFDGNGAPPAYWKALRQFIESDSVGRPVSRVRVPMKKLLATNSQSCVVLNPAHVALAGDRPFYVGRFRAVFYQPVRQVRTFKLDVKNPAGGTFLFVVDGVENESKESKGGALNTYVKREFSKGVHRLEVFMSGGRALGGQFEILTDSDKPPYMAPLPEALLNPGGQPELAKVLQVESGTVTANKAGTEFELRFATNLQARVIRLLLADFEGNAPAIRKIHLNDTLGRMIIPTTNDLVAVGKNDILDIIPGDKVSIAYADPKVITNDKKVQSRTMTVNFHDAEIMASVNASPVSIQEVYRFLPGERINVLVKDPDCDVSDKSDVVKFAARIPDGKPVEFRALETEAHSGVFLGSVFTTTGTPQRADEIRLEPDANLSLSFVDRENTDPGVPFPRNAELQPVVPGVPALRVYEVQSVPVSEARLKELPPDAVKGKQAMQINKAEYVPPNRDLAANRPEKEDYTKPTPIVSDGPLLVELTYPSQARFKGSTAELYVQTLSGRKMAGLDTGSVFSLAVPGTVKVQAQLEDIGNVSPPPGYLSVHVRGDPYAANPVTVGRFSTEVKKEFGRPETGGNLGPKSDMKADSDVLKVLGNDEIFVGFPYGDATGVTNWVVQRVLMTGDAFFDVMDRHYRALVDRIYVGDSLYFRFNQKTRDSSDEKDAVPITIATGSGFSTNLMLVETFEHSGSFKGLVKTVYALDAGSRAEAGVVPVDYGDTVTVTCALSAGQEPLRRDVAVHRGADGDIMPFSKRFRDAEIAVQTQFAVAEAYFELAKKHRALEQADLALSEIAQGRKILEEAIHDYPETENRVHADYLLADLALEFANNAADAQVKKDKYLESIRLFSELLAQYPNSMFAPKAQYKKALTFEMMGEMDNACEEYVKLSYTYPDSDLIAETIVRIGNYFAAKAKEYAGQAAAATDKAQKARVEAEAKGMFRTAAEVFSRLGPRFPSHQLAAKTMVIAGQCYMQAGDLDKAAEKLEEAIKKIDSDNDLRAEAMYWRSDCLMQMKRFEDAYHQFKTLTWDYPSSKWAKFARGRLAQPELESFAAKE
ncbi:MAG: outer membrane protein assembly factor BamD, partial [Lentisphaerae bacterium]|nr:outer membrane protein assembly factor BamD [Lentisphaerota bacterium]